MKCPKCSGAGYIYNNLVGYLEDCSVCNGTGEVQMTNEEWLRQANTEQLAEFLADELNDAIERVLEGVWLNDGNTDSDEYYQRKSDVVEWLKQPHHEKE